jgi:hypothetical protein
MKFKVYNKETHEDVTDKNTWVVMPDGELYFPEYDSFVKAAKEYYMPYDDVELMMAYPECGDWETLYINGKLTDESHRIPSTRILQAVGEAFKCNYGFMEIPDEIAELGMPEKLWELKELVGESE